MGGLSTGVERLRDEPAPGVRGLRPLQPKASWKSRMAADPTGCSSTRGSQAKGMSPLSSFIARDIVCCSGWSQLQWVESAAVEWPAEVDREISGI